MTNEEIFRKLTELESKGIAVCLATIVRTLGSTPREAGAKMIVCADGTTYGSVGGGCGENQVRSAALRCLLTTKTPELIEADLTDDLGTKGGDVCGGRMWLFVEPL
ncbi:MAG: XdhC family protein [Deltaproteobacteria bacterium]|nr:XdhC family protein [Deltaproteobacteria bacterium]